MKSIRPSLIPCALLMFAFGCPAEAESGAGNFDPNNPMPGTSASGSSTGEDSGVLETSGPTQGSNSGGNETTGDDPTDPTNGFVTPDDAGVTSECDPWAQDCNDGEKCVPYRSANGTTWDANRCVPVVANPKTAGEECFEMGGSQSGEDDCDAASTCNYIVEGVGVCTEMCTGSVASPICETPSTACNVDNDGTRNLCAPLCDPLLQDCPDESRMTCLIASDGTDFTCELGWGDGGTEVGEECVFDNACLNGNFCLYVPDALPGCVGNGCCTPYCETNDDCTVDGTECLPYFTDNVPPGYEELGYCALPG